MRLKFILIWVVFGLYIQLPKLWANGGFRDPSATGGNIFSEIEHPTVSLQKEVIWVKDSTDWQVDYIFYNEGNETTVRVAFPINLRSGVRDGALTGIDTDKVKALFLNSKRIVMSFDKFDPEKFVRSISRSFEELEDDILLGTVTGIVTSFNVIQDNKPVKIEEVILEKSEEYYSEIKIYMTFTLKFPSRSQSHVRVSYRTSIYESGEGDFERSYSLYWIGPGRTWKGPIEKVFLVIPGKFVFPSLSFSDEGWNIYFQNCAVRVYVKENYEPEMKDEIYIWYNTPKNEEQNLLAYYYISSDTPELLPLYKAYSSFEIKNSSGYIPDITTYTKTYGTETLTFKLDFKPENLLDGRPETAWAVKWSGKAYVEFYISSICGTSFKKLILLNGYWKGEKPGRLYHLNHRVKNFRLYSKDGKYDRTFTVPDTPYVEIELGEIPEGTYVFEVLDIYKGSKYNDLCISELIFEGSFDFPEKFNDELLNNVLFENKDK